MRWFFDTLTGARLAGLDEPEPDRAAAGGHAGARRSACPLANFTEITVVTLPKCSTRHNLLARVLTHPGAQALPGSARLIGRSAASATMPTASAAL